MAVTEETALWLEEANQPDYRERLRAALKARKMSQADLASQCGCSPSNISAVLRGGELGPVPKYIWATARWWPEMRARK